MDFRDRVVIVTGASSGIGWVTAEAFAARGARVVAVARREENLKRLIEGCRARSPDPASSPAISACAPSPSTWSTTPSRDTAGSTCS